MAEQSQEQLEVIDEFAERMGDPDDIVEEANRLGMTVDDLLARIVTEIKTRMTGMPQ